MMREYTALRTGLLAATFVVLVFAPTVLSDYWLSFLINVLCFIVLTTAWRIFSGPTRYFSLAVAAFFGIGSYVVAVFQESLPLHAAFLLAGCVGAVLALVVGLTTLRVSGVHFVIFTFGLTELIRELAIWWEINQTKTVGRYVLIDFSNSLIYLHLLTLTAIVFGIAYLIEVFKNRSGLARDWRGRNRCGPVRHQPFRDQGVRVCRLGSNYDACWSGNGPALVLYQPQHGV